MPNQGVDNKYFANDGSPSIEAYFGPHISKQAALDAVPNAFRVVGRRVGVIANNVVTTYTFGNFEETVDKSTLTVDHLLSSGTASSTNTALVTVNSGATLALNPAVTFAYNIILTENFTITPPTLVVGNAITLVAIVTGDFLLDLSAFNVTSSSDIYDGTIANRLVFDCYHTAEGVAVNYVSIENL